MEFLPAPERLDPPVAELHLWRLPASPASLREVLAIYLGGEPEEIELATGAHGKPRLAQPGLRFNLSHSGALALVAVSAQLEVGVDLEQVRPGRDVVALAERALGPEDVAAVRAAPAARRDRVFHQRWTCHEARLKCLGVGLSGRKPPAGPLAAAALDLGPGYAAAIAVEAPELPPLLGWTFDRPLPGAGWPVS